MSSRLPGAAARAESLEQRALLASPLVITAGGVYSGTFESQDPTVPAVLVKTSDPVVIENSIIRSRGDAIASAVDHTKITVRNTSGYGLNPNVAGRAPGRFFDVENFDSADIENNYMENTAGIYMLSYAGNHTTDQTIVVRDNKALNIDGRKSDGAGGWLDYNTRKSKKRGTSQDGMELVQFLQFDKVRSVPGIDIAWNEVINQPGNSRVEDNINIYLSSGTASSPMLIHDNYIQGAYTIKPGQATYSDATYTYDWSFSGGGILIGDGVSSTAGGDPGFIEAFNNQVVSTTNYGIAIAAGHDNEFYNNRVLSAGVLSDGTIITQQNVGLYVWDSYNAGSSHFYNNLGHDNLSGWVQGSGRNDWWSPVASNLQNNTHWPGTLTTSTEAAEYALWQQKLSAHRTPPPAAPAGLAASAASDREIDLTWSDVSGETLYHVERSADGVSAWTEIATPAADATTYSDTDLLGGTTYSYRVRASNAAGNGDYSNITSAATMIPPAPLAPADLVASPASYKQINLTWTDSSDNESGFRIERSLDGVNDWTQIATPARNATSYSDSASLSPGTQYFYRILATNAGGDSDYSNVDDATTDVLVVSSAPTGLAASATSSSQINLTWTDASSNETGFVIERSPDGVSNWTQAGTALANATTFSDTARSPATTYYYRVYATGDAGPSDYSNTASATTPQIAPAGPTNLVASTLSSSSIKLTWTDKSNNEAGFSVERSLDGVHWTAIKTLAANATTYTDSGLTRRTKYYYRVVAFNAAGNSPYSNTASATTASK